MKMLLYVYDSHSISPHTVGLGQVNEVMISYQYLLKEEEEQEQEDILLPILPSLQ